MANNGKKQKIKESLSLGLLVIAAVLAGAMVVKLIGLGSGSVAEADEAGADQTEPEAKAEEKLSQGKELAQALKKKNMFVPPPGKPQPPGEVKGILGARALINGKWYEIGDTVPPGAKMVAIEATQVKLQWEGKEIALAPINAAGVSGVGKPSEPDRPPRLGQRMEKGKPASPVRREFKRVGPRLRGRGGLNLSEEKRKQIRDKLKNMKPQERREYRRDLRGRNK